MFRQTQCVTSTNDLKKHNFRLSFADVDRPVAGRRRIFCIFLTFNFFFQLTTEHEHTLRILEITKENQNALAAELADAKV